jgi:hypothetical protein
MAKVHSSKILNKKHGGARSSTKPKCGGLTRGKGTNKDGSPRTKSPCTRSAGHGTDHLGQGRCKFHGGCTPIKHGLYSTVIPAAWRENYQASLEAADPKSMMEHIALLDGVILPRALQRGEKASRHEGEPDPLMVQLMAIETKSKLVHRLHRMEDAGKIKFTEADLELFVAEIITIIAEFVNADTLRKITARFGACAALSEPH